MNKSLMMVVLLSALAAPNTEVIRLQPSTSSVVLVYPDKSTAVLSGPRKVKVGDCDTCITARQYRQKEVRSIWRRY